MLKAKRKVKEAHTTPSQNETELAVFQINKYLKIGREY